MAQSSGNIIAVPFDLKSLRVTGDGEPIVTGLPINSTGISGRFTLAQTGRLAYVTGEEFNRTDLVRVRRDGTTIPVDTSRSGNFRSLAVSPDGRWVAADVALGGGADELRLRDLTTGARVRIAEPGLWLRAPPLSPGRPDAGLSRDRLPDDRTLSGRYGRGDCPRAGLQRQRAGMANPHRGVA